MAVFFSMVVCEGLGSLFATLVSALLRRLFQAA